jgi:hypothetical protein
MESQEKRDYRRVRFYVGTFADQGTEQRYGMDQSAVFGDIEDLSIARRMLEKGMPLEEVVSSTRLKIETRAFILEILENRMRFPIPGRYN